MRDYERLRKAAQALIDGVEPLKVPWNELHLWHELRDALTDTAETSEMERLIPWLEDQRRYEHGGSGECVLDRLADFLESLGYRVRDAVDIEINGRIQDEAWDGLQPDCMP